MDQDILVASKKAVSVGIQVVSALESRGIQVAAAMWLLIEGSGYKLYIATPAVETQGPIHVYGQIREAIREMGEDAALGFDDVIAANSRNHFVNDLKSFVSADFRGVVELRDLEVDGRSVIHALVFKVTKDWFATTGRITLENRHVVRAKTGKVRKRQLMVAP